MKKVYIYCLRCPLTNEIKYIGKTVDLSMRKRHHMSLNKKINTKLEKWKSSLRESNLSPIFELMETCNELNWEDREKYYISSHDNLLNMTIGGEGYHGFNGDISENHMSQRTKGRKIEDVYSPEQCREIKGKLSSHFTGRVMGTSHHTDDYLRKQVVSNSKVPILVIDTVDNKEYSFINSKEAAIFLGVNPGVIRNFKRNNWKVKKRFIIKNIGL